jgi:hypothetical protein
MVPPVAGQHSPAPVATPARAARAAFAANSAAAGVPRSHITQITTGGRHPIAVISMIVVNIFSAVKMRSMRTHFYRDHE